MRIYAIAGLNQQTVVADDASYTPAPEEIEMNEERPAGDYIAAANGTWVIDKTPALEALTAEYRAEKANLCESFTSATMQGDTETADSISADLADLDAWYDAEYEKIVGEA